MADSQRIWTLLKQKTPLSAPDQELLEQSTEWKMWVSHGIPSQNGKSASKANSLRSKGLQRAAAVL